MSGTGKAVGAVPGADESIRKVEDMLSSPSWQERLDEARRQRDKILDERKRLGLTGTPDAAAMRKPWEQEPRRRKVAAGLRVLPAAALATPDDLMQDALAGLRQVATCGTPLAAAVSPVRRKGPRPEFPKVVQTLPIAAPAGAPVVADRAQSRHRSALHVAAGFVAGIVVGVVLTLVASHLGRGAGPVAWPVIGSADAVPVVGQASASLPAIRPMPAAPYVAASDTAPTRLPAPAVLSVLSPDATPASRPDPLQRPTLHQPGYLAVVAADTPAAPLLPASEALVQASLDGLQSY